MSFPSPDNLKIPELDDRGLRRFALTLAVFIVVAFWLLVPWVFATSRPLWPWFLAALLGLTGIVFPARLRGVYRAWMVLGLALNKVVSPVALGLVFYLVVTPTGMVMRLVGKDPLSLEPPTEPKSFRVPSQSRSRDHMERPY